VWYVAHRIIAIFILFAGLYNLYLGPGLFQSTFLGPATQYQVVGVSFDAGVFASFVYVSCVLALVLVVCASVYAQFLKPDYYPPVPKPKVQKYFVPPTYQANNVRQPANYQIHDPRRPTATAFGNSPTRPDEIVAIPEESIYQASNPKWRPPAAGNPHRVENSSNLPVVNLSSPAMESKSVDDLPL